FYKQQEYGLTMVLVTHDPSLSARCAREIHVRSGQIHAEPLLGSEEPVQAEAAQ
ncbi:MAG: ABC transporter ATP-binding protein, partial [Brucellaceae bacterium]|nr:ABC transporter ATP-binding protein [Brucellaceae bacterium]